MNDKKGSSFTLWKQDREMKNIQESISSPEKFDQDLQIELNKMKGGLKAQAELPYIECPKGKADYFSEQITWEDGTKTDITYLTTDTKKKTMIIALGDISKQVFHANKKRMDMYQRYQDIGLTMLIAGLVMVDLYFHLNSVDDVSFRFWEVGWVGWGGGIALGGFFLLEWMRTDSSLAVWKLTVQDTYEDYTGRIAHFCIPSAMPLHRVMELLGAKTEQGQIDRMNDLLKQIFTKTEERWDLLKEQNTLLARQNVVLSNERNEGGYVSDNALQAHNRTVDLYQTLAWPIIILVSLLVGFGLSLHYGLIGGG